MGLAQQRGKLPQREGEVHIIVIEQERRRQRVAARAAATPAERTIRERNALTGEETGFLMVPTFSKGTQKSLYHSLQRGGIESYTTLGTRYAA